MSSNVGKSDAVRFAILTVSDTCSKGEAIDSSGAGLAKYVDSEFGNGQVVERKCVPDDTNIIAFTLSDWADRNVADVILTTGGTGFAHRDVTPEATRQVLEKEAPGLSVAMLHGSLAITPMAMLSRAAAGIRKQSVIINLPGSSKGSLECLKFVAGQLKHAVDLLREDTRNVVKQHLGMGTGIVQKTNVDALDVANRPRQSKYPTIPVPQAQEMVLAECLPLKTKNMSLKNALGYILAEDVFAADPLPPFPASIKDGYAVKVSLSSMETLNVMGHSSAGELPEKFNVTEGVCVRISTGAPVPPGADAVVQVEDTELVEKCADGKEEKVIRLLKKPVVGQDIRPLGSDIRQGQKVVEQGSLLGASELGVLATVGVSTFSVHAKPVVALLSTGNELVIAGDPLSQGKIRDSNKTTLNALYTDGGFSTVDLGIAPDTPQDVLDKLTQGLEIADIVVSTGGVSMGERDYLKEVLLQDLKAEIHFGCVLMKPGKPTTFATCTYKGTKKFIFGLPGNPVSATVTAHLFVVPACRKLSGWSFPMYTTVRAKIEQKVKLDKTRPEYHRGVLVWNNSDKDGFPVIKSTGNQISSRLLSCSGANALMVLPKGSESAPEIEAGTVIEALLISSR